MQAKYSPTPTVYERTSGDTWEVQLAFDLNQSGKHLVSNYLAVMQLERRT
ncbi:MAG: hypothetical protein M3R47_06510 [Chloroflexota bacterium]|nr:hypothetical protein [Chloroflexota bacterium]